MSISTSYSHIPNTFSVFKNSLEQNFEADHAQWFVVKIVRSRNPNFDL